MSAQLSRESFFAIYWDHAQQLAKFNACLLARIPKEETLEAAARTWDDLLAHERIALRQAIMQLIELHDSNRTDISRFKNFPHQQPEVVPSEKR